MFFLQGIHVVNLKNINHLYDTLLNYIKYAICNMISYGYVQESQKYRIICH